MDETRRILKTFGVAVTDFQVEAEKLKEFADQLSSSSGAGEIAALLRDVTGLCAELNERRLEVDRRISELQGQLLSSCAKAASSLFPRES